MMQRSAPSAYIDRLETRLAAGAALLPAGFKDRQRRYILSRQLPDGGFNGLIGESDSYYTAFGVRCAALLDIIDSSFWTKVAGWLTDRIGATADLIDRFSLLVVDRFVARRAIPEWTAAHRSALHLSARSVIDADNPSPDRPGEIDTMAGYYSAFISLLSRGMLGDPYPRLPELGNDVLDRIRAADRLNRSGVAGLARRLSKLPVARRWIKNAADNAGVSQIAAAVAILSASGGIPADVADPLLKYIASLQRPDGGVSAHPDAPMPDGLSSFTALNAVMDIRSESPAGNGNFGIKLGGLARFITELESDGGGFRGVINSADPDVEYTFYGIASFGLDRKSTSLKSSHVKLSRMPSSA